ncbi:MAG TPA: alpha/beta hydrolase [Terriglobales bacterium]|nr:alpha/beta hydrolase [Terriglobales bacterium]
MKRALLHLVAVLTILSGAVFAQEAIPLYSGPVPGSLPTNYPEKEYFSKLWNTEVVTNVTHPTLMVFKASGEKKTDSAAVICPGGGFMALSIESEGTEVARWLADRGMTTFVLKYRLAHTGEDATQEFTTLFADREKLMQTIGPVIPMSIDDGLAAVTYVRKHASDWGISADRVGVIGFSAGGTVAAGVGLHYEPDGRPAFVAPIYPAINRLKADPVPADAPPMFIAAASDDNLGLAPDSIALYEKWVGAKKSVELHMYAVGGHGFGMRKHGHPSDTWIDRLGDWLQAEGFLQK